MVSFPTSYNEIMERINQVDPVAYAKTRNYTNGAVSYLSPYIARGVISLPQIVAVLIAKGFSFWQSEKFIQELAWREYFQRIWQAKGDAIHNDLKQAQQDVRHYDLPDAIQNAKTGITAIDESIGELYRSGYMHNHVRMYTASITCNIAQAYWQQPAAWMYYHLLDGDIASNTCSWQWVAGAFSTKKYYCNQENVNKYTGTVQTNTFLDAGYAVLPVAAIPEQLKDFSSVSFKTILPQTGLPVIDTHKPTLIYNSYNLDPLWRKDEDVNRVLLLEVEHFERYPVSEKVIDFIIALSKNIPGIQLYAGSLHDLKNLYPDSATAKFIYKEHPAFTHYTGQQDQRDWLFEEVSGYYPSFFAFWKNCMKKKDRQNLFA